ncbi:MAG: hypothetical protein ACYC9J_06835 [Sulfuricaulis sp.]
MFFSNTPINHTGALGDTLVGSFQNSVDILSVEAVWDLIVLLKLLTNLRHLSEQTMLTRFIEVVLGVIVASPFLYRAVKRGDKASALVYLLIATLAGFILGRMLIIQISDGVI